MECVIRSICVVACSAQLCSACARAPEVARPKTPPALAPLRLAAPVQAQFRGYRLAQSFVEKGPFRDGAPLRIGAIVNGLRVRTDATGMSLAQSVTISPLQAGAPLPDWLGGGLLFWNETALYTSDTFLGALKPLLDIGYRPVRVSFGPQFALVRGSDGQRLAIDLQTRRRVAMTPPLLVDIVATSDGRALALLEGGRCQISDDAGKSYRPLALPVGTQAIGVREASGALLATLSSGAQMRLEKGSEPRLEAAPQRASKRSATDAPWPLDEPPLEHALAAGAPIGQEFAGVAVAGSVATVSLRTGELVQMTRALVPSDLPCRTLDASGVLLLACSSPEHGSVVIANPFGEHPVTEAKFPSGVWLDFAEGVLVAGARCDGQVARGAVCVRGEDAHFRDFDVSASLAALEKAAPAPKPGGKPVLPSINHWVPRVGGGAVAVIGDPSPGLIDAGTGKFTPFSRDVPYAVFGTVRGQDSWLGLDWVTLRDGGVRGWLPRAGVAIGADGRLEPSVYEFDYVGGASAHALAFDHAHHVFQSADWGRSWIETLAPPGSGTGGKVRLVPRCSQVGCLIGPWLRVGWEPEVPAALSRAQVTTAPPTVMREPLPLLTCKQLAAPAISQQALPSADPDPEWRGSELGVSASSKVAAGEYASLFSWATVHPINGLGGQVALRAVLKARSPVPPLDVLPPPAGWPGYAWNKQFSFVPAFEPRGNVQSVAVGFRALFDVARASDAPYPRLDASPGETFAALPVLGRSPGEADGLVLNDSSPVWVHGSADALSLGARQDDVTLISAVATAPHTVAVLSANADGALEVLEVRAGRPRRLFQLPGLGGAYYPANADALAIDQQGTLAVLRTPSGSEPATSADPAVMFHSDGSVGVLAPWSRLFLADAPECRPASNDYRAILQTSRAWLRLVDGGQPVPDEQLEAGMFAMLRMNADRLCLEAVELADVAAEGPETANETHLAARFVGHGRGAARLGFTRAFELHQALSCSLSSAR